MGFILMYKCVKGLLILDIDNRDASFKELTLVRSQMKKTIRV